MSGVLVVFAKFPRPGFVKTRMTPPLTPEQAAALYTAMLEDVLETSASCAAGLDLEPVLAVHPPDACGALARRTPPAFRVIAQRGADLAGRMAWAVDEAAAGGASPIVLRGSDSPALGPGTLGAATAALRDHDLVLSPDRDGGYNLVGLVRPARGLFDHAMSTPSVLDDTLANARELALRVRLLEPGFDLDTADDLRWLAEARQNGAEALCPRTLAALDSFGAWRYSASLPGGR